MTEPLITKDILVGMKNYINLNGWYQGFFYDTTAYIGGFKKAVEQGAPMCVMGAYQAVSNTRMFRDPDRYRRATMELTQLMEIDSSDDGALEVANWNDQAGRTKQEVLDVLDKAVQKLDG